MAPNLRDRRKLNPPIRLSSELAGCSSQSAVNDSDNVTGACGASTSSQPRQHISLAQLNEAPTRGQPPRGVKRSMLRSSNGVSAATGGLESAENPRTNHIGNGTERSSSSSTDQRGPNNRVIFCNHSDNIPPLPSLAMPRPRTIRLEHPRILPSVASSNHIYTVPAASLLSSSNAAADLAVQPPNASSLRAVAGSRVPTPAQAPPPPPPPQQPRHAIMPAPAAPSPLLASGSNANLQRRHVVPARPSQHGAVRHIHSFLPNLKFPSTEERAQIQNEVRDKLSKYVSIAELPYVSNCVKAALFRGHLRLVPMFEEDNGKSPLDRQRYSLTCYACKGLVEVSLRQFLFQPDKLNILLAGMPPNMLNDDDRYENNANASVAGTSSEAVTSSSSTISGRASPTKQRFKQLLQQEIRCGECQKRNAVADFCAGRPYLCDPYKFRHCSACPNWGICTEDRQAEHCGKCHAHSTMPCVNCGSYEYIKPQSPPTYSLPAKKKTVLAKAPNSESHALASSYPVGLVSRQYAAVARSSHDGGPVGPRSG